MSQTIDATLPIPFHFLPAPQLPASQQKPVPYNTDFIRVTIALRPTAISQYYCSLISSLSFLSSPRPPRIFYQRPFKISSLMPPPSLTVIQSILNRSLAMLVFPELSC